MVREVDTWHEHELYQLLHWWVYKQSMHHSKNTQSANMYRELDGVLISPCSYIHKAASTFAFLSCCSCLEEGAVGANAESVQLLQIEARSDFKSSPWFHTWWVKKRTTIPTPLQVPTMRSKISNAREKRPTSRILPPTERSPKGKAAKIPTAKCVRSMNCMPKWNQWYSVSRILRRGARGSVWPLQSTKRSGNENIKLKWSWNRKKRS